MNNDIKKELKILISAKYPIIYILSWEENRVEAVLKSIARETMKKIFFWSCTTGIVQDSKTKDINSETMDPVKSIAHFLQSNENGIYVFKDLHPFLKNELIIRLMRDVVNEVLNSKKNFIILSPVLELPTELTKEVTIFDFPLPDINDLESILDSIINAGKNNPNIKVNIFNKEDKEKIVKAAIGLTHTEAENVFARALVNDSVLDLNDIDIILKEKQQIIRKSGILEYIEVKDDMNSIGGLENLKEWIRKRSRAFTKEARSFGLPEPKGILLLGVQGCGKSVSAKAVASMWHLPILRLDVGAVFGKYIGESESNIRRTILMAESISPVILWIDEIEKAFAGMKGDGDSGTSSRVFGTMLTWLQEKTSPVFVIATSNDISILPPELIRKGRFDEIFFVDLPNEKEREEIFTIHLKKRKKDVKQFDCAKLASISAGFSGAEIEQVVISAMYDAFDENRQLGMKDLIKNAEKIVPLSVTAKEKIQELRNWARDRAISASK